MTIKFHLNPSFLYSCFLKKLIPQAIHQSLNLPPLSLRDLYCPLRPAEINSLKVCWLSWGCRFKQQIRQQTWRKTNHMTTKIYQNEGSSTFFTTNWSSLIIIIYNHTYPISWFLMIKWVINAPQVDPVGRRSSREHWRGDGYLSLSGIVGKGGLTILTLQGTNISPLKVAGSGSRWFFLL